jgi:hypothetical protein
MDMVSVYVAVRMNRAKYLVCLALKRNGEWGRGRDLDPAVAKEEGVGRAGGLG